MRFNIPTSTSTFLSLLLSTSSFQSVIAVKSSGLGLVVNNPGNKGPTVSLSNGIILIGKALDQTNRYTVPYAAPPVGALRLVNPVKFNPGAYIPGSGLPPHACPQNADYLNSYNEDCLYMTVFTPKNLNPGSKVPVLVWIHGGSFIGGSANLDASALSAQENIIVVQIQYRLGVLGFLHSDYQGISGNFGLKDIIMALTNIQNEIVHYGGDPTKVTLAGQSSGAELVATLLVTPSADSLFARAILHSAPLDLPDQTVAIGNAVAKLFFAALKITTLTQLQTLSVQDILVAQADLFDARTPAYAGSVVGASLVEPIRTVVDGKLVTRNFGKAASNHGTLDLAKSVIFTTMGYEACTFITDQFNEAVPSAAFTAGVNQFLGQARGQEVIASNIYTPANNAKDIRSNFINLISDFSWVCPAQEIAVNLTAINPKQKIYLGQFNVGLPLPTAEPSIDICAGKPVHEGDIALLFQNGTRSALQTKVSKELTNRWGAYVRSGNPNTQFSNPQWLPVKDINNVNLLEFGGGQNGNSKIYLTQRVEQCRLWGRRVQFDEQLYR